MIKCNMCPRECGAERSNGKTGFCRTSYDFNVAKIMLHKWEEPCISGSMGAGTVFFSGCNLRCIYCQNKEISRNGVGAKMNEEELIEAVFKLADGGAACIEFVTPTHYTQGIARMLEKIKSKLNIPTVWNSGGYEKSMSLRLLDGLIDIYLPDFKYFDSEIAQKYSSAPNYREVADEALEEMLRQTGKPVFDENRMMKRGVIVRHLVLPSHRGDSINVLLHLASKFGRDNIIISLMSQYTPDFYDGSGYGEEFANLRRRLTKFEYDSVMRVAEEIGFEGYFQGLLSSDKKYTPDF